MESDMEHAHAISPGTPTARTRVYFRLPLHLGLGRTTLSEDHWSGVTADAISKEWKSKLPVSSVMADVTIRWRLISGTPSNLSDTTTTLKWLSSDRLPWDVLSTSRCVGCKKFDNRSKISLSRGPAVAVAKCRATATWLKLKYTVYADESRRANIEGRRDLSQLRHADIAPRITCRLLGTLSAAVCWCCFWAWMTKITSQSN